jgi:uncharacterized membrane protein
LLGSAWIVGAFLLGIPSIIAVIMNYLRRPDVRGTWLESHFSLPGKVTVNGTFACS